MVKTDILLTKKNDMKKNFTKQKVAILGSSLPMLLLAYYLKNKKNIDTVIIDNSQNLGGAWQKFNYKGFQIRKQSNIIVPINKLEEKNQNKVNAFLKKNFNIKIHKIYKKIITSYKTKNQFSYDFDYFLRRIPKEKIFKKVLIKKIRLLNNGKVEINNKLKFDLVFVPSYFGIKKIYLKGKVLKVDNKAIQSEHVITILRRGLFKNIYYSDFFNNFFDRVQFMQHGKFTSFSARISKEKKGSSNKIILSELKKIFQKDEILKVNKFKYENFYRNKDQIKELKKIDKSKSIIHINTTSLMTSMIKIMNYLR